MSSRLRFELRNKERGIKIKLSGDFIRLGRAEDNDIILNDPSISRYHLNIYIKEHKVILEDAGSKTGFYVNGAQQKAPCVVKHTDQIKIGAQTFTLYAGASPVQKNPEQHAQPNGSSSTTSASQENAASSFETQKPATSSTPQKKRILIYGAAAMLLILFVSTQEQKPEPLEAPIENFVLDADALSEALEQNRLRSAGRVQHMSRGEIESLGKFNEGMREYRHGNYVRAIQRFQEALTQNPSMDEAADYLQFSQARLQIQIQDLMEDGQRSFSLMQYSRAKSQFAMVLSILSEQIPGYWARKMNEVKPDAQNRMPAQEEFLLNIPCDQTKNESTCALAVELIKQSRLALGEEDTIR